MKCKACSQEKNENEFYLAKTGYRNQRCQECESKRKDKLYQADKASYKNRARLYEKQKVAHNKEFIENYKLAHPCIKCGETDICCLDFHHVNPDTKLYDFGTLKKKAYALATILAELAKCVSLCASCHRKFHAGRFSL